MEMWRCELPRQDGTKCGKLAYNRDLFANHLCRRHNVPLKSPSNDEQCEKMHLGREGHHHFWCGFCERLIAQQDSMQDHAWDLRFKHIGDHFDKDEHHIDHWVDIETNKKKGFITNNDRKKAKARSRNGEYGDDSDLGEDGIPTFGPGYSAPVSRAPPGFETGMPAQASVYTSTKRRMAAIDEDAEGVSDEEFRT